MAASSSERATKVMAGEIKQGHIRAARLPLDGEDRAAHGIEALIAGDGDVSVRKAGLAKGHLNQPGVIAGIGQFAQPLVLPLTDKLLVGRAIHSRTQRGHRETSRRAG